MQIQGKLNDEISFLACRRQVEEQTQQKEDTKVNSVGEMKGKLDYDQACVRVRGREGEKKRHRYNS